MAPDPFSEIERECRPHSIIPRDDTCVPDESYLQQLEEPGLLDGLPDLTRVCSPQTLPPEGDVPHIRSDVLINNVAPSRTRSAVALVTEIKSSSRMQSSGPRAAGENSSGSAAHLGITDAEMQRFVDEADAEDAAHTAAVAKMALVSQISSVVVMIIYFMGGVLTYMYLEDWTMMEGFYFVVVTVTTVGYGNLVPKTDSGKWFTCVFVFTYIGLIGVAFGLRVAFEIGDTGHIKHDNDGEEEDVREDQTKVCFDCGKMSGWKKNLKNILLAFMPAMFVVFSGTFFFMYENDLSFTDAVYFSCVSQTTVGYGDIAPVTEAGRIFALFWLFAGVIVVGWSVQTIGAMYLRRQLKAIQRENLRKRVTVKDLVQWGGEDAKLDRNEFALAKLIAQSKISMQDIDDMNNQFNEMDEDNSGLLDTYDILAASRKDGRAESFTGPATGLTTTQTEMMLSDGPKGTILFADHWFRHT